MIRTALYIDHLSVVTVRAVEALDSEAQLYRYNQTGSRQAVGVHELVRGIYQIISNGPMEISATGIGVGVMRGKDDPPEPDARVLALEPGATAASVKAFFAATKDF